MNPLLDVLKYVISYPKPVHEEIADEAQRRAVELMARILGTAVMAIFEMNSVHDDLLVVKKMAKRYPWKPSHIKKSEHLKLVWFQHINLCYLFEEKVKLVLTRSRHVDRLFRNVVEQKFDDASIRALHSKVKEHLGEHIRARGQTFHEWYQDHEYLKDYRTIELVHSFDPEKFEQIEPIYWAVRSEICSEITASATFMEESLVEFFNKDMGFLIEAINRFAAIVKICKETPANINLRLANEKAA